MASNTPNIDLYKKDPIQDQNDTFNIDTMLNENWDKIDQAVGIVQDELKNNITQTTSLNNTSRVEHIVANQNCGIDLEVDGQMLVNLLGRDGSFTRDGNNDGIADGWVGSNITETSISNGIQTIKANTIDHYHFIDYPLPTLTVGHKYFIQVKARGYNNARCTIMAYNKKVDDTLDGTSKQGTFNATSKETLGMILIPTSINDTPWQIIRIEIQSFYGTTYSGNETTPETVEVSDVMMIDLTAMGEAETDVEELLVKYPYTNSARPLLNPTVEVCGKNLVRNGNGEEGTNHWNLNYNTKITIENGRIKLTSSPGAGAAFQRIRVKPNTNYYFNMNRTTGSIGTNCFIREVKNNNVLMYGEGTINIGENEEIEVGLYLNDTGYAYFDSIQLEQGTTPTQYKPYQGGEIIFPTELAKLDNYQDKLIYKDGVAKVFRNVKHVVLDGSFDWLNNSKAVDTKTVRITNFAIDSTAYGKIYAGEIGIKYDGKKLETLSIGVPNIADNLNLGNVGDLYISIANKDSGWGENYTPTLNEIKAYFNGWKMFDQSGGNTSTYDGTGNKGWVEFENVGKEGFGVPTLPTTSYDGFTPYQLYYALAEPIEEEIHPIILGDGFNLVEGHNTIAAKSGMMWEKVEPKVSKSFENAYIAGNDVSQEMTNKLAYQNKKIVSIYKEKDNSMIDCTYQWTINPDTTYAHGVEIAYIPLSEYDNKYNYYVSYEVLHEDYDSQLQEVTVNYEGNIRQTLNETVETIGNMQKDISRLHDDWYQVNEAVEMTQELSKGINTQNITLTNANLTQHIIANQNCGVDVEVGGEMIVNLLGEYGDFNNDSNNDGVADGWLAVSSSNLSLSSNTQTFTATSIHGGINHTFEPIHNNKYYARAIVKADSTTVGVWLFSGVGGGAAAHSSSGEFITLSAMATYDSAQASSYKTVAVADARTSGWTQIQVKQFILLNLTEIFGEGNEPTLEWCDDNIPYTNSAQPLLNPTVEVCGKNLVRNGNSEEGINYWKPDNLNTELSVENNKFKVTTTSGGGIYQLVKVKKNTNYFITSNKQDGTSTASLNVWSRLIAGTLLVSNNGTFNTGASDEICISMKATGSGYVYFDHTQLEQSISSTPYESFKGGQVIFPNELTKIGSYQDKLIYKDGVANVDKEINHLVLDGRWNWALSNRADFKQCSFILPQKAIPLNAGIIVAKYNGAILTSKVVFDGPDYTTIGSVGKLVYLSISNTDSGWGNGFAPNQDEVKAYFNGWRMYDSSTHTSSSSKGVSFDTFGTKTWVNVNDISQVTNIVPTTQIADNYTPYQLYYALQEPIQEEIQPIILGDGVNLIEGQNTLTVKSGYVWEKANIVLDTDGRYYINNHYTEIRKPSRLSYKTEKIVQLYKDGIPDIQNWIVYTDTTANASYGNQSLFVSKDDNIYDPQSEYYVLYEVQQEDYNCQLQETKISYESNIRQALNETVETTANNEKLISDLRVDLLPMKDKEKAMSDLDLLNTDIAAEMKDKINEIINILRGD